MAAISGFRVALQARECIKPPEAGLSAQSLGLNVGRPADVITPEPSATAYEPAPISLLV